MALTPQQQVFAEHFALELNATAAARHAGLAIPQSAGPRLAANVEVKRFVMEIQARRLRPVKDKVGRLVAKLERIAHADPAKLSGYHVSCCRHCHGVEHAYQWKSPKEWAEAVDRAMQAHEEVMAKRSKHVMYDDEPAPRLTLPESTGGFDFDHRLSPNEDCPKCDGKGIADVWFADTRLLGPDEAALYAGTKRTKDGAELKTNDQVKAIELLGRYHGIWDDKLTVRTPFGHVAAPTVEVLRKTLTYDELLALDAMNDKMAAAIATTDESNVVDVEAREVQDAGQP